MKKRLINEIEVKLCSKVEWDELIQDFEDATIYQTWAYGSIRWGTKKINHLIVTENSKVIGLAQVLIERIPVIGIGIAYVPWGPLWRKFDSIDYLHFLKIIQALKKVYAIDKGLFLRTTPNESVNKNPKVVKILEEEGFIKDSSTISNRTFLIDLSLSLEDIRKGFNSKWRNQLNRAEKNDLTIVKGTSMEMYNSFLNLQKEMVTRKGFTPGVDYEEFGRIQSELTESQKMRIFLCQFNGEIIAVSICSHIGDTGIYLLGATGDKGLKLNGSNLLQWHMIQYLKRKNCKWYDLGGINPDVNPGVYHFKKGIAGKNAKETFHIGRYEFYSNLKGHVSKEFLKLFKK